MNSLFAGRSFSGDRAWRALQRQLALWPDEVPDPPLEEKSNASARTMRVCAVIGLLALIAGGLVWLPGTRQNAEEAKHSDDLPIPVVEKRVKLAEVRSATVAPPIAENDFAAVENDLAAAIGKPIVAAPSIPTPEVAPKSESALAPDASNPVSGSVSPSGTPNPKSESAGASAASNPVSGPALAPRTELATVTSSSVSGTTPASEDAVKLANDEIAMLLRLAKNFLINGDVASARLLLRRAAAAGNAEAAFVLGTTFDPLIVRQMGIIGGVEPDIARARQWYERAAERGSTAVMMMALRYSNCASLLDFCPRP
jgi:hypothetical protein